MTSRRHLLAALAVLALAAPAHAADRVVTAPMKKVFPYLEAYLSMPPAERSRFAMAYRLTVDGAANPGLKVAIVRGAERTPLPLDGFGRIARLPNLAMLKSDAKVELAGPQGHKIGLALELEPNVAAAAEMDAHALALACDQATTGAKKAAGVLGFAAPRLDRVVFQGAAGGQAVNAQGRATPLAMVKGNPVFDPAKTPDAKAIRFTRAPTRLYLDKAS
mgnify:CR=1 FL=1